MHSSPGLGTLPRLKTTGCDLQPVGSLTGSALNRHVQPQGGNGLGAGALKPAQHPMSQPQTSLDAQKLLVKGPGGVGSNLRTFRPSSFAISFDVPIGGIRMTRENLPKQKAKSQS